MRNGFVIEIERPVLPAHADTGSEHVLALDPSRRHAAASERREHGTCDGVPGFSEAAVAARDPSAPAPARLVLLGPCAATSASLACWAEDSDCVRRTITIRRLLDGKRVTAIATLASYGFGVDTSLAIESVALSSDDASAMLRSGVHPKATAIAIERALANEIDS